MQAHRVTPWLAGLLLVLPALAAGASPDAPISPSVAALFVDEEKIVEGTVTAAERDGNVVRLRFGTTPQALTVSLVIGLLSNFPPTPERYYLGQTVRVAGTIRSFRGTPEIVIHDPAHITVVGAAPPAAADRPVPTTPVVEGAAALREQVRTLSERVRVLEEQLQELRGGPK